MNVRTTDVIGRTVSGRLLDVREFEVTLEMLMGRGARGSLCLDVGETRLRTTVEVDERGSSSPHTHESAKSKRVFADPPWPAEHTLSTGILNAQTRARVAFELANNLRRCVRRIALSLDGTVLAWLPGSVLVQDDPHEDDSPTSVRLTIPWFAHTEPPMQCESADAVFVVRVFLRGPNYFGDCGSDIFVGGQRLELVAADGGAVPDPTCTLRCSQTKPMFFEPSKQVPRPILATFLTATEHNYCDATKPTLEGQSDIVFTVPPKTTAVCVESDSAGTLLTGCRTKGADSYFVWTHEARMAKSAPTQSLVVRFEPLNKDTRLHCIAVFTGSLPRHNWYSLRHRTFVVKAAPAQVE